jgi:hypothetical protein
MLALGSADVAQTRFRKGLAADAPDRNRTSARGLGRCVQFSRRRCKQDGFTLAADGVRQ